METQRTLELHIPSILGFEKVAMSFAASVAQMMKFPYDRVDDLKTAVAEACIDAIEHGNNMDEETKIGVMLTIEGSRLQVDIQDQGGGVGSIAQPNIEEKMAGKEVPRGWGVFLIEKLMDQVEFETRPEGGNVVRMVIHLEKPDQQAPSTV